MESPSTNSIAFDGDFVFEGFQYQSEGTKLEFESWIWGCRYILEFEWTDY